MKIRNAIITVWLLLLTGQLFAQYRYTEFSKSYAKSYVYDAIDAGTAPRRWTSRQWIFAGAVTATSLIVYSQDENLRDVFHHRRKGALDDFSRMAIEPWGNGLYSLPLLAGFYAYGKFNTDDRAKATALNGLKAFVISGAFTEIIKQTMHRHRPYQDDPANRSLWEGPIADFKYSSFPSNHTATAFAVATVIASEYYDVKWVSWASYSAATMVALSRLYSDKHWASDVLMGAALGYGIGRTIIKNSRSKSNVELTPVLGARFNGACLRIKI